MCLFCEIVKGNIPCYKIYEDDDCLAFLDISQATIGHTLVIPKEHFENFFDLPEEKASKIMLAAKEVTKILKSKLNLSNLNLINNSGRLAEQAVMHFHLHIIPRYEGDGIKYTTTPHEMTKEQLDDIYKQFKN